MSKARKLTSDESDILALWHSLSPYISPRSGSVRVAFLEEYKSGQ